jgi:hypothetical protein
MRVSGSRGMLVAAISGGVVGRLAAWIGSVEGEGAFKRMREMVTAVHTITKPITINTIPRGITFSSDDCFAIRLV